MVMMISNEKRQELIDHAFAQERLFMEEEFEACRCNRHDLAASASEWRRFWLRQAQKLIEGVER